MNLQKPPTEMLRVDRDFSRYLRDRAKRERVSVPELTRRILRLTQRKQAAFE
jgi:hypothetical protein